MKNIYTTIGLFLIFIYSYGQSASNYTFTAVQGSYIPLTGVPGVIDTSVGATDDNVISSTITLPFTFTFAGTPYTSVKVSSNGFVSFLASATDSNTNTQANADVRRPILFPLWDDLKCTVKPRYIVTGIAPHRRFKVEWIQQSWNNGAAGDVISFQVWLFETTNVVEFLYSQGAVAVNSGSATIGIHDGTGKYLTLNNSGAAPSAQSDVFTTSISTKPATGQIYRFSPPAAAGLEANNYCFTPFTTTYSNLASATDVPGLAASADDAQSNAIALPFTFNFGGAYYSNIRVSSNGWITFASPSPNPDQSYMNTLVNANIIKPILFPLWDDVECTTIPKYTTSGTAPNRIFKVEWNKQKWDYNSSSDAISFQVWLYEKNNIIEYIYKPGAASLNNPSASIGIYDAGGKYLNLNGSGTNPAASSSVFTFTIGTKPANGQGYRFSPPPLISYPGNAFIATGKVGVTQTGVTGGTYSATPSGLSFVSTATGEVDLTASAGGTYTITYSVAGCVNATTEMTIFSLLPQPTATIAQASCLSGSDGSITITNMNNAVKFVAADNDYIDLNTTMLSNRSAFTMEGWIKFKSTDITGRMSLFGQNNVIEFGFASSSAFECWTAASGAVTATFTPAVLGNEQWHHIAVTGDGTRIRIYIDGTIVTTSAAHSTSNYGTSAFSTKIGSRVFDDVTTQPFSGNILKVGFYNTALSASRITSLAFGPTTYSGVESGIIAGYNFFDGSGTTLTSTPAGNNGSFFNSPEWIDPYTYIWQKNGSTVGITKNITGLSPGDYRVTVSLIGVSSPNAKTFTVGSEAIVTAKAGTGADCTSTITANWDSVSGTTNYLLDVATDAAFTNFLPGYNSLNVSTALFHVITNVPPGPIYYRVRRNTLCGVSANSNVIQYQTLQVKTPVATDVTNLLCNGFTANWTAVDGANAYYLDVATDTGFTSFVSGYSSLNVGNVTSRIITGLSSGVTYYYRVRSANAACGMMPTSSNTISILINVGPSIPVVGTITQATCAKPLGSVVLSGLPAGEWTLKFLTGQTYSGSGTSVTLSDLVPGNTYNIAVTADVCFSGYSANIAIAPLVIGTSTWNGSWTPSPPTINDNIVFAVNSTYTSAGDISGCTCTLNSGATVTVSLGDTFTITNAVTTTGGTLTFENTASLVQTNDVSNTGNITYKRISLPMKNFDYTYWSSPIAGQVLNVLSPNTLADKYFSYNSGWKTELPTAVMTVGKGYIIRTPKDGLWGNGENVVFPYSQQVRFFGVPNNGYVSGEEITALTSKPNFLIGNPYPSALSADLFLLANNTILEGTIYFWTHNTPIAPNGTTYIYSPNDYASYNTTGGVGTSAKSDPAHNDNPALDNGKKPSGKIAAGQSFFAVAKGLGRISFTNAMRIPDDNNQFFKPGKTANLEKNRLWLDLSNGQGIYKQTLIGYIEGATDNYEDQFDGVTFDGNSYVDLYSINNDKKLVIQGRALPFENSDIVPLGYKTTIAGNFTISINQTDGVLSNQPIYLEDKQTQTIHDLQMANYTFTTAIGTFDDRFVLKYTNTNLGSDDFEKDKHNLIVAVNDKVITINSVSEINKVFIYDISGKLIYKKEKINSNQFSTQLNVAEQVLLVKIFLENDREETRKIIFR